MEQRKRLEIVVANHEARRILQLLERTGAPHYSMVRDVSGRGDRGVQDGRGLSETFINVLIVAYLDPEVLDRLRAPLAAELKRFGGVAAVTDAEWLSH